MGTLARNELIDQLQQLITLDKIYLFLLNHLIKLSHQY